MKENNIKRKRDFEQIFQDLLYCLLYTRYLSCGSFPNAIIWNQIYFSKKFFTGWVVVFIIWLFYSAFQVIIFPIWESRTDLYHTFRGIYWDLTGQTYKLKAWQNEHPEEMHAVRSQLQAQLSRTPVTHEIVDGKAFGDGYVTQQTLTMH